MRNQVIGAILPGLKAAALLLRLLRAQLAASGRGCSKQPPAADVVQLRLGDQPRSVSAGSTEPRFARTMHGNDTCA